MTILYLESHITIDPIPDESRAKLEALAGSRDLRIAKFVMRKGEEQDQFLTGRMEVARYEDGNGFIRDTCSAIVALRASGFKVRRYKVEATLVDSRESDVWGFL